jgi:hypothetical protein
MEKPTMTNLGIFLEILETGRLVLNENNRNEITHFHGKTIEEFIEIKKKLTAACKDLEKKPLFCRRSVDLNR